jgi:hypothetical protein
VVAVFEPSRNREREFTCPEDLAVTGNASAIPTLFVSSKFRICKLPKTCWV